MSKEGQHTYNGVVVLPVTTYYDQQGANIIPSQQEMQRGVAVDSKMDDSYFNTVSREIRNGFIRKVYGILSLQLLVTFGLIATFQFVPVVNDFVLSNNNTYLLWVALGLSLVTMISLVCFPVVARRVPFNYLLLFTYTLAEAYILGWVAVHYSPFVVMTAMGMTGIIVVALTLFACQTKYDVTGAGGYLLCAVMTLLIFGLVASLFRSQIMSLVYASFAVLLFSFFIVYDTQLIVGGKHRYSFGEDDYILAVLSLYMDIVNLFLYLLQIVGAANGE
jgi:FtsH-binding integral membrane protein